MAVVEKHNKFEKNIENYGNYIAVNTKKAKFENFSINSKTLQKYGKLWQLMQLLKKW